MLLFNDIIDNIYFEEVFNLTLITGAIGYGMLMLNEFIIFLI